MNGNWLTKTKKAYVYHCALGKGWHLVMLHGQTDRDDFWYPTWELAVRAIPDLWRH